MTRARDGQVSGVVHGRASGARDGQVSGRSM